MQIPWLELQDLLGAVMQCLLCGYAVEINRDFCLLPRQQEATDTRGTTLPQSLTTLSLHVLGSGGGTFALEDGRRDCSMRQSKDGVHRDQRSMED